MTLEYKHGPRHYVVSVDIFGARLGWLPVEEMVEFVQVSADQLAEELVEDIERGPP